MIELRPARIGKSTRWGIACLPVIAALGLLTIAIPTVHAEPFQSSHGYEITGASGWTVKSPTGMAADVYIITHPVNGFAANLNVVVTPGEKGETLQSIHDLIRSHYSKMFTNFYITGERLSKLGGDPSYEITATYSTGTPSKTLRMHQVFVLRAGLDYIFTCTDTDKHYPKCLPQFATMLGSVHWTQ